MIKLLGTAGGVVELAVAPLALPCMQRATVYYPSVGELPPEGYEREQQAGRWRLVPPGHRRSGGEPGGD